MHCELQTKFRNSDSTNQQWLSEVNNLHLFYKAYMIGNKWSILKMIIVM